MTPGNEQVSLRILDKEYLVACPPEEKAALLSSARLLDEKIREIRAGGRVIGGERIAVMAALNLAHDLLQLQEQHDNRQRATQLRLQGLSERILSVLEVEEPQMKL